jgi:hypothetical protein
MEVVVGAGAVTPCRAAFYANRRLMTQMGDEITLLVAEARVHDKVFLSHIPSRKVELFAGDILRVRMSYRVSDQRIPEELWAFQLTTRIDDGDESVSERILRDRKLVSDDIISNVGVDLDFPVAGDYKLSYEVFAQLAHRKWDDATSFDPVSTESEKGELTVHVIEN